MAKKKSVHGAAYAVVMTKKKACMAQPKLSS